jgi:hypothetical protein
VYAYGVQFRFAFAVLTATGLALGACARPEAPAPPPPEPGLRAVDLPPVGRFRGVLPCPDCDGVRTEILLAGNWEGVNLYHLTETYVGATPPGGRTVEREGAWTALRGVPENDAAVVYQLDPDRPGQRRHFLVVDERTIRLLDDALRPIGDPLVRVDGR